MSSAESSGAHARLQDLLQTLGRADDRRGAAVATRDGLVAAHALPGGANADSLCAMAAASLAAAETAWIEAGLGAVSALWLHGDVPGSLYTLDDRFFLVLLGGEPAAGAAAAEQVRDALASAEV